MLRAAICCRDDAAFRQFIFRAAAPMLRRYAAAFSRHIAADIFAMPAAYVVMPRLLYVAACCDIAPLRRHYADERHATRHTPLCRLYYFTPCFATL